ncbi:dolichyl-phosphate-mannose-protein mannosyltransferase [Leptospira johnsonii]|uniref:Dolichyl-phosphate-mannose-protein mannosyltransferase n=2 Tax=Leptospira johnsonii TaxID=1917820 RepID=A0A2P2CZG4_9LEPT|nr:dolichyl-phosphate-mannose-protein mannosyltransferase [Leptospira johnsonii]
MIGILIGFVGLQIFKNGKEEGKDLFLVSTWISTLIFIGVLSFTITPKIISFLQDGNLRLYDKAEKSGNEIVYYKYLSFYPMFYREKKIHMIGSYKFKDEISLLDSKEKLSIICNRNSELELILMHPQRSFQEVSSENGIVLLDSSPK